MNTRAIRMLTMFSTALLLNACGSVPTKAFLSVSLSETQTYLLAASSNCLTAKQKAILAIKSHSLGVSNETPNQIGSTLERYKGATKGLLFTTQYAEEMFYTFSFAPGSGNEASCQISIKGQVCERPDNAEWKCEELRDLSRAEARLGKLKAQYERELK